jgi:hypothetical protein
MAITFAPTINITNVSKGMKSLNSGLGNLKKSSDTIKTVTLNRTRIKRESFARDKVLSNMREEAIRRKDQESIIEASGIGGAMRRSASVIGDSTKGFLERILDFSSSLLIGWLLYNLPTIMTAIEDLIIRIKSLYRILTDFMGNIKDTLVNFGDLLSGVYYDISHFDFTDQSKKVQGAMDDLNTNLDLMHDQFIEGFDILSKPLGEGPGEEPVPEVNTDYTQDGPTSGEGKQSPSSSSEVGGVHKQALNIIAKYESESSGGYNAMNQGGEGSHGIYGSGDSQSPRLLGKKLTDMTVSEIMRRQAENNRYSGPNKVGIFAAGRYQIIPDTLKGIVKSGVIKPSDKFDERTQDKAGLQLIKESGIQPWAFDSASRARFSSKELNIVEKARKTPVSMIQSPQPTPPKSTQPTGASGNVIAVGKGIVNQGFSVAENKYFTKSKGFNLKGDSPVWEGHASKDHGTNALDVTDWRGSEASGIPRLKNLFLSLYSGKEKYGIKALIFDPIGYWFTGMKDYKREAYGGHHNHLHVGFTKSADTALKSDKELGIADIGAPKPQTPPAQVTPSKPPAQVTPSKPQIAQVTPPKPPGQNVPSVAQDKKGPTVLIADNPSSPPTPQQVPSSNESQLQMIPFEDSLNSLIKNQILLELAYT